MTSLTIRAAQFDDWPTIADLNCRLAMETEDKQLDLQVVGPGVQALLSDPSKGRYFVATSDCEIVGQLMYTLEWSDWRNGNIWWIQSVYVVDDFRRQGVFRRLYDHLHQLASQAPDVVGIRLYVEQENEHAQAAYQRLGMSRSGYHVMEKIF